MNLSLQKEGLNQVLYRKSLKENEWRLTICLALYAHLEHYKKTGSFDRSPFSPSDGKYYWNFYMIQSLFPDDEMVSVWDLYEYLFQLKKEVGIGMKVYCDKNELPESEREGVSDDLIYVEWEGYDWNTSFDILVPQDYFLKELIPYGLCISFEVKDTPLDPILSGLARIIDAYLDIFMNPRKDTQIDMMEYKKQRNRFYDKIVGFFEHSESSKIMLKSRETSFNKGFSYTYMIALLWSLEYIEIIELYGYYDGDDEDEEIEYDEENPIKVFQIKLQPFFLDIMKSYHSIKEIVMDKIFDEEYKKISILKKGGSPHILEGEMVFKGDETLHGNLKKKYPYSDINSKNHGGKTTLYEVKEKIKLNKSGLQ